MILRVTLSNTLVSLTVDCPEEGTCDENGETVPAYREWAIMQALEALPQRLTLIGVQCPDGKKRDVDVFIEGDDYDAEVSG